MINNWENIIVNGCSVLGFAVSIYTLITAKSIKASIKDTQNKVIFSQIAPDIIQNIKDLNRELVNSDTESGIKEILYKIKTKIDILLRSIPVEYKSECLSVKKQIEKQYEATIMLNGNLKNKKCTSKNDIWDTYNKITGIIDYTQNIINEKRIIS